LDCEPRLVLDALSRWDRKHGKPTAPKPRNVFLRFTRGSKSYDYSGGFDETPIHEIAEFFGVKPKTILGKILAFRDTDVSGVGEIEL